MIKKILRSTFIVLLVFCFLGLANIRLHATVTTSSNIKVLGSQMRTDSKSGIRFVCSFKDYTVPYERSISKYGVCVAYGKGVTDSDVYKGNTVNGKSVAYYESDTLDELTDKELYVTVWNIPSEHYETYMKARAYVVLDNSDMVYGTSGEERNLVDVARSAKADGATSELITTLTTNKDVKVTSSSNVVTYYANLASVTIADGDEIDLIGGKTYSDALTINKDNVTIKGNYSNETGISIDREEEKETVLSSLITVKNGADNFTLIGCKLIATDALKFQGSQDGATVKNNIFSPAADGYSRAIFDAKATSSDEYESLLHSNFDIQYNYFEKLSVSVHTRSNDIYFLSVVKNLSITNNNFYSVYNHTDFMAGGTDYDYAIKANRLSSDIDNTLLIKDNNFLKLGSFYVIDLAYSNSDSLRAQGNITIENNEFSSSSSTYLGANGIRLLHLGANATVNIIHNTRLVVSRYYNTLYLSNSDSITSTDTTAPTFNIKFNLFYTPSSGEYDYNDLGRNEVTSRYCRIGIGIQLDTNEGVINFDKNYFSSNSTSRAAYSTVSSKAASTPNHSVLPSENKVESYKDANAAYKEYAGLS